MFHYEGGEALNRLCEGCTLPARAQGQMGWGPGHHDLTVDISNHSRGFGIRCSLNVSINSSHFMILK